MADGAGSHLRGCPVFCATYCGSGMPNLIHKNDLIAQRAVIEAFYDDVYALRRKNPQLATVFGSAYMYRLDHRETEVAVWNMRRAPPIVTIDSEHGSLQLCGQIGNLPCEFPDLDDVVVLDCTVDQLFDPLVKAVPENWESQLNKRLYAKPLQMLEVAVSTVCRGDLPWQLLKADEVMRRVHGWDTHDLPGNPWVQFAGRILLVKTQRLQASARAEMLTTKHTSVLTILDCWSIRPCIAELYLGGAS